MNQPRLACPGTVHMVMDVSCECASPPTAVAYICVLAASSCSTFHALIFPSLPGFCSLVSTVHSAACLLSGCIHCPDFVFSVMH